MNYKHLKKRVICEEAVSDKSEVKDYKLFCYAGKARFIQVDTDRHGNHMRNLYDVHWNALPVVHGEKPNAEWEPAPEALPRMRDIAEEIARHFESVRVDLYLADSRIYVGELTHCHLGAGGTFGSLDQERIVSRLCFD